MRVSIIQIGNSKGLRIPQSILKQCGIESEVEMEIQNKNIIIKPIQKKDYTLTFDNINQMEDVEIQLLLKKLDAATLAISLISASKEIKEKIFKNLSDKNKALIEEMIESYNSMDAKQLLVEMQKAKINLALAEI